jgi:hypothetical protein
MVIVFPQVWWLSLFILEVEQQDFRDLCEREDTSKMLAGLKEA